MRIVPSIAKSWTISPDGTVYTFTLRDDVYFHQTDFFPQKRKVTAEDFVYSLGRIVDGSVASPGAWIFQKVKRDSEGKPAFKALNDSTFQITLSEDFPPFLGILAMKYCSVVPREVVEKYGKDFRTLYQNLRRSRVSQCLPEERRAIICVVCGETVSGVCQPHLPHWL